MGVEHYRVWLNLWAHGIGGGAYRTQAEAVANGKGAMDCFEITVTVMDGVATSVNLGRLVETPGLGPQPKVDYEPFNLLCKTCHLPPHNDCIIPGCPLSLQSFTAFPASPVEAKPVRDDQDARNREVTALFDGEEAERRDLEDAIRATARKNAMQKYARPILQVLSHRTELTLGGTDLALVRDIVRDFCEE